MFNKKQSVNVSFSYGNQLSIGDQILIQENSELAPEEVLGVSNLEMQGNHDSNDLGLFVLFVWSLSTCIQILSDIPVPMVLWSTP